MKVQVKICLWLALALICHFSCSPTADEQQALSDVRSDSPWDRAVKARDLKQMQVLLERGVPVNESLEGDRGYTALCYALAHEDQAMVRLLLSSGASWKPARNAGGVPLQHVKSLAMLELLLQAGLDVNHTSRKHAPPVFYFLRDSDLPLLKRLVRAGANLRARPEVQGLEINGWTTLMVAADNNEVAVGEYLIRQGVAVNAGDDFQTTPLHLAVEKDHVAFVRLLLKHYADPTIQSSTRPPGSALQDAEQYARGPEATREAQEIYKLLKAAAGKTR